MGADVEEARIGIEIGRVSEGDGLLKNSIEVGAQGAGGAITCVDDGGVIPLAGDVSIGHLDVDITIDTSGVDEELDIGVICGGAFPQAKGDDESLALEDHEALATGWGRITTEPGGDGVIGVKIGEDGIVDVDVLIATVELSASAGAALTGF